MYIGALLNKTQLLAKNSSDKWTPNIFSKLPVNLTPKCWQQLFEPFGSMLVGSHHSCQRSTGLAVSQMFYCDISNVV